MDSTNLEVQANFKRYLGNNQPAPEEYIILLLKNRGSYSLKSEIKYAV